MAAHSHDDFTEVKPVSFTVPFILAAVTLLVMGLFLSLCDPSHAQHGSHKGGGAHEQTGHHKATDKDMQSYGKSEGPPAHAESPAQGETHQ